MDIISEVITTGADICDVCGEKGLHVCVPQVLTMLVGDPTFKKIVREYVKEALKDAVVSIDVTEKGIAGAPWGLGENYTPGGV